VICPGSSQCFDVVGWVTGVSSCLLRESADPTQPECSVLEINDDDDVDSGNDVDVSCNVTQLYILLDIATVCLLGV